MDVRLSLMPSMSDPLDFLARRHSTPARQLGAPAPDEATLQRLLGAAIRVPDHGKLVPFRLIRLEGPAKLAFGARLFALAEAKHPEMPANKREKERGRYAHAPLVVVVVAHLRPGHKVPEVEQRASANCVAHSLLLGAFALGYGAQWLTGWAAYDTDAAALLGLGPDEHVVGFVHIGTAQGEVPERARPALTEVVSTWTP